MPTSVDTLLIDVRANTQGFATDVAAMRGSFDGTLVDGFSRAGDVLERGLLTALRKGSIGFEDLRRVAMNVIDQIASRSLNNLFGSIGLGGGGGGGSGGAGAGGNLLGNIGTLVASLLGSPGRATGGPVSPGRGYLVGERGPELFMPASAGRIENGLSSGGGRDVRVSININAPSGTSAPQALQRSSRQVASAVRRALSDA